MQSEYTKADRTFFRFENLMGQPVRFGPRIRVYLAHQILRSKSGMVS